MFTTFVCIISNKPWLVDKVLDFLLEFNKHVLEKDYLAVLFQVGAEDVINIKKLNFVKKLVQIKGTGQCLSIFWHIEYNQFGS